MDKRRGVYCLAGLALVCLTGCGGGLGLTGGSVPIGGRAITGVALLPNAAPLANAPVTVRTLSTGAVVRSASTDGTGRFTVSGVPTDADVSLTVHQAATTLAAVVPQPDLAANGSQPLDIGQVTAVSTVVSQAVQIEQAAGPEDAATGVADQAALLTMQAAAANYSVATQDQIITDPNSLAANALALLLPAANSGLTQLSAKPTARNAGAALTSLLAYLRSQRSGGVHLGSVHRAGLIAAQLMVNQYSAETVAAHLNAAGVAQATEQSVTDASQAERARLTALESFGPGITGFEALAIAADSTANGGFQLDRPTLDTFLTHLLGE
jgi:hypothetical protein